MRSRWPRLFLPLASMTLLALAPGACHQVDDTGDGCHHHDAGGPGCPGQGGSSSSSSSSASSSCGSSAPGFSFAVLSPNVTVPLAGKNTIEVEVQRTGGFNGDVTVAAMSLPLGLLVEPVTIPASQTSAEIVIGADAPLALGNKLSFTLVATSGALLPRSATVTDALVTGRPGTLDATFGAAQTGLARVSFGADDNGGFYDFDVVGDQIVAAGQGFGGLGGISFVVTRLTSSGALDPGFAMGMLVKSRFGTSTGTGASSSAVAVGHQISGRIIAMGWHEVPNPGDIALQRYGVNGSTGDPIFGSNGKSLLDLGGIEQVADGVVLPNDKIVVVGQRGDDLMVSRAASDGALDTSFAAPNGYLVSSLGQPSSARSVVVDSQSRILVLGHTGLAGQRDLLVARFLQNGQPDMTFGAGGQRILEAPGSDERAAAVAVLGDGRILVAGDSNAGGNIDFQVRRLLADGTSDPSFGTGGVAALPISAEDDSAEDMVVLPDGKILLVGNVTSGIERGPVLARYKGDGKLDPYFGAGGVLPLYVGDSGIVHCAAVYPGHQVVIGGGDEGGSPGPGTYGIVARMWM